MELRVIKDVRRPPGSEDDRAARPADRGPSWLAVSARPRPTVPGSTGWRRPGRRGSRRSYYRSGSPTTPGPVRGPRPAVCLMAGRSCPV